MKSEILISTAVCLLAVLPISAQVTTPDLRSASEAVVDSLVAAQDDTMEGIFFVDIDSTLLAGDGLLLAFGDTIPFAEGTLDTVLTTAPRVTVEEVVRRIGLREAADRARIREHSFTGLLKVIGGDDDYANGQGDWSVFESAERQRLDRDGQYQNVRLWQREREYKDGELDEEKIEDEVEVTWADMGDMVTSAQPFSVESGDAYNYEILERHLVGMSVVYKIRFTPKSRFKGLASGSVWVDLGDYTIRRIHAEMMESVPMPMILEGVPEFRIRFVQRGDFWVLGDIYARIELQDIPLLGIPNQLELFFRTTQHSINGTDYPDGDAGAVK